MTKKLLAWCGRVLTTTRLLRISALLTLVGLGFMVWSLVEPTPMPVILAMSVGQVAGIVAFGIYLFVILMEFRRSGRKDEGGSSPS